MKFNQWADKQFGKEPSFATLERLRAKRLDLFTKFFSLDNDIKKMEFIIKQRKAALYAWNIKDKDKK